MHTHLSIFQLPVWQYVLIITVMWFLWHYYKEIYKIKKAMKENIIQAIVADMQRDLDCLQIARLKAVLHKKTARCRGYRNL